MKKTTLVCALLLSAFSQAQVSLDLEAWTTVPAFMTAPAYDQPNGWTTSNVFSAFGNPISVTKVSDSYSGSAACIQTVKLISNPLHGQIPDTVGIMFTGSLDVANAKIRYGYPYTQRSEKLQFYYKYTPSGTDTAYVLVAMSKWNASSHKRDTIAQGYFEVSQSSSTYSLGEILLDYDASYGWDTDPDSVVVIASSSSLHPQPGSKLYVDQFVFTAPNAIPQLDKAYAFQFYPSPAKEELFISFPDQRAASVSICDMQGQKIQTQVIKSREMSISLRSLSPGIYFLALEDREGKSLGIQKLTVIE